MHPFPHIYHAAATAEASGPVAVTSGELPRLETAAPPEFDGPGGVWSPETTAASREFSSVSRAPHGSRVSRPMRS